MKHLFAILATIALVFLGAPAAHAAAATTIDLTANSVIPNQVSPAGNGTIPTGQVKSKVIPTTFTTVTAEQQIDIKGFSTKPVQIQLQGTNDWYYKTTASGASIKVIGGQGITIWVEQGTTLSIFVQRVTADGVVTGQIVGP